MKRSQATCFALGMLSAGVFAFERPFPAAPLIQAINEGEKAIERDQRQAFLQAGSQNAYPFFWDPSAMPGATLSWMLQNMPKEAWQKLRDNRDSKGEPLL